MDKRYIFTERYLSPCGELILGSYGDQLCLCDWMTSKQRNHTDLELRRVLKAEMKAEPSAITRKAACELDEYFHGQRKSFDLPLLFVGTPFQKSVWETLLRVPYGETRSYAWMAKEMGNDRAVRAVGHANGCNPIVIFAPCHRIVGANGSLTGYAGGLSAKQFLLDLEARVMRTEADVGCGPCGRPNRESCPLGRPQGVPLRRQMTHRRVRPLWPS